jgi:hypothetical protein
MLCSRFVLLLLAAKNKNYEDMCATGYFSEIRFINNIKIGYNACGRA